MKMELTQFAAVNTGADGDDAIASRRVDGQPHRARHGRLIDAVDDNLVRALATLDKLGLNATS